MTVARFAGTVTTRTGNVKLGSPRQTVPRTWVGRYRLEKLTTARTKPSPLVAPALPPPPAANANEGVDRDDDDELPVVAPVLNALDFKRTRTRSIEGMQGLSVAEAAQACGLKATALRYYEQAGLIPPVARDGSGRRVFTEQDLAWIRYAVCLRSLGMGVVEIARYVSAASRVDGLEEQMALLVDHLERMLAQRTALDHYIAIARTKLAANGVET